LFDLYYFKIIFYHQQRIKTYVITYTVSTKLTLHTKCKLIISAK
jgi:hypothetical protein